jgi:hypothetical protein
MINNAVIEKYKKIQKINGLLPVKVSKFYLDKVL